VLQHPTPPASGQWDLAAIRPESQRSGRPFRWDLLVVANPVWETSWLVPEVPPDGAAGFDPAASGIDRVEDGGGSALNTACALAAAGRRVLAVGRIGDDAEGRGAVAALERRGIDTRIEIVPGRASKRNHVYVAAGDRAAMREGSIAFRAFVPHLCVPAWEEWPDGLAESRILLLDRLAAASPAWLRRRAELKSTGPFLNAFNRNSPSYRGSALERFQASLPFVDYIQISESTDDHEARGVTEIDPWVATETDPAAAKTDPPAARVPVDNPSGTPGLDQIHSPPAPPPLSPAEIASMQNAGVSVIVRTRGASGVIVLDRGEGPIRIPASPTRVIDSTGAGDAFAAGFLDALLDGAAPPEAARRGVDWGARACRHLGARGWLDREPPEDRRSGGTEGQRP
jgi:sugar/nucleoside kinase (ribokinase family)